MVQWLLPLVRPRVRLSSFYNHITASEAEINQIVLLSRLLNVLVLIKTN